MAMAMNSKISNLLLENLSLHLKFNNIQGMSLDIVVIRIVNNLVSIEFVLNNICLGMPYGGQGGA